LITKDAIKETVYELYKQAVIVLGDDVKKSLEDALKIEEHELARLNIEAILKNIELAEEKGIPMCQDTGLPVIFVKLGNVEVENLREGIEEGIKKATTDIPIRPNIVDPLTRENTNINVGDYIPPIDIELIDEDYIEIKPHETKLIPTGIASALDTDCYFQIETDVKQNRSRKAHLCCSCYPTTSRSRPKTADAYF
jgi:fumarate hydratase subunit alpha